ncbi:MAG: hypothetical protein ABRQ39_01535 [Candidatus Eremiobacterota bacterium]
MKILIIGGTRFTEDICDENNYEQDIIVITEKIRKELGYREIVSFEEGLRRTVAWERETQHL